MPIEQEDLIAEGSVGLLRAAMRFDASFGVPFSAYAVKFVRGAIADVVIRRSRRNSDNLGGYVEIVSLDERWPSGRDLRYDPADPRSGTELLVEEREQIRLIGGLPKNERYALIRTEVDGVSGAEVGKEMGVSADRVYQLAAHGATRLRKRAA